jgi:hypothetical protein
MTSLLHLDQNQALPGLALGEIFVHNTRYRVSVTKDGAAPATLDPNVQKTLRDTITALCVAHTAQKSAPRALMNISQEGAEFLGEQARQTHDFAIDALRELTPYAQSSLTPYRGGQATKIWSDVETLLLPPLPPTDTPAEKPEPEKALPPTKTLSTTLALQGCDLTALDLSKRGWNLNLNTPLKYRILKNIQAGRIGRVEKTVKDKLLAEASNFRYMGYASAEALCQSRVTSFIYTLMEKLRPAKDLVNPSLKQQALELVIAHDEGTLSNKELAKRINLLVSQNADNRDLQACIEEQARAEGIDHRQCDEEHYTQTLSLYVEALQRFIESDNLNYN